MEQDINGRVSAGLTAETKILTMENNKLFDIRTLYLLQQNKTIESVGLNNEVDIVENKINMVGEEYAKYLCEVKLSNGFSISATAGTMIFTIDGWKHIGNLEKNEGILGVEFSTNPNSSAPIFPKVYIVTSVDKKMTAVMESVYLFTSDNSNILLPYPTDNNEVMSFICIHE